MDRIHFIHEIWEHSFYFFISPSSYDANFFNKICHEKTILQLENAKILLYNMNQFTSVNLRFLFQKIKNKHQIMQLFRLALVGVLKGIDIFIILEMLGKEESIQRIEKLINQIKEKI